MSVSYLDVRFISYRLISFWCINQFKNEVMESVLRTLSKCEFISRNVSIGKQGKGKVDPVLVT
jgi:hypothetical protein